MRQHYSAVNYWTPCWIYPRSRLREPFPRRRRSLAAALLPPPQVITVVPELTTSFVAGPRGTGFVAGPAR